MANEQNLRPVRSKSEAREKGKKGGIKSGETRRARKTLKEELLLLLGSDNNQLNISVSLINEAKKGNTKAYEVIRDTIGEKPKEEIDLKGTMSYENAIREVVDSNEY